MQFRHRDFGAYCYYPVVDQMVPSTYVTTTAMRWALPERLGQASSCEIRCEGVQLRSRGLQVHRVSRVRGVDSPRRGFAAHDVLVQLDGEFVDGLHDTFSLQIGFVVVVGQVR